MATITDITLQRGNKNRVNIFLDNAFYCGLERITVETHRLKIGGEIEQSELDGIQRESESEKAFSKGVALVSKRLHSEKEIRKYLKEKGYVSQVIGGVIKKMKEYRYINDEAFAEKFVECYKKKYGKSKILFELKCRGVSEEIAQDAVQQITEEEFCSEAVRLIDKFIRTHSSYTKDKIVRYMFSHGFSWDQISEALPLSEFNAHSDD